MKAIAGASFSSLFGVLISVAPLVLAAWFAARPSERLLSLMRPLTLAAVFSALSSLVLALTNGFAVLGGYTPVDPGNVKVMAATVAEGLAPVAASFACLTVAWILVTIGMRRG